MGSNDTERSTYFVNAQLLDAADPPGNTSSGGGSGGGGSAVQEERAPQPSSAGAIGGAPPGGSGNPSQPAAASSASTSSQASSRAAELVAQLKGAGSTLSGALTVAAADSTAGSAGTSSLTAPGSASDASDARAAALAAAAATVAAASPAPAASPPPPPPPPHRCALGAPLGQFASYRRCWVSPSQLRLLPCPGTSAGLCSRRQKWRTAAAMPAPRWGQPVGPCLSKAGVAAASPPRRRCSGCLPLCLLQALQAPKVALLFLTRGDLHHHAMAPPCHVAALVRSRWAGAGREGRGRDSG